MGLVATNRQPSLLGVQDRGRRCIRPVSTSGKADAAPASDAAATLRGPDEPPADHLVDDGETLSADTTLQFRCEVVLGSEQASPLRHRRRLRVERGASSAAGELSVFFLTYAATNRRGATRFAASAEAHAETVGNCPLCMRQ